MGREMGRRSYKCDEGEMGRERAMDLESIKKTLFTSAMKGKWEEVVEMYEKDARVHLAKITRSEDTALHIAVSDGKVEVVAQMVQFICKQQLQHRKQALQIENERGNTALHFAASMGNEEMCQQIGGAEPSLVGIRNVDGETPLFLAALHGRKQAFLCLHYLCNDRSSNYDNCRRNGGDTILQCAIAGEYFDLAFQIIQLYGELVNSVNEEGLSPLHQLAAKPSAFKSGSRLGRIENIVYHFMWVEELQAARYDRQPLPTVGKHKRRHAFPENYATCRDLFRVIKTALTVATNKFPLINYLKNKFVRKGDPDQKNAKDLEVGGSQDRAQAHQLFPANYRTCCNLIKFVYLAVLVILGQGSSGLKKIYRKKEKHNWSVQLMNELLKCASPYEYDDNGSKPQISVFPPDTDVEDATAPYAFDEGGGVTYGKNIKPSTINQKDREDQKSSEKRKMETPILIAAKNGVMEMVEKILELFPVAIHDMNADKKNIVLLAVENRQPHVYQLLLKRKILKESLFRKVDNEGNSALHLAAKLGYYKPWLIPGAALQMQWEIKWYEFVKESMPPHFFVRYNRENKTPKKIFTETHEVLVQKGGEWLNKTSESCSVVAALIATVAFATSATVPGGVNQDSGHPNSGHPILEGEPAFSLFAISSLIALCCSITSVVMFLSILTSRYQEYDFGKDLPTKLIIGLSSLFMSIASMVVSFCAGHFFVLEDKLHYAALPIYAVTSLPVSFFALAQFPLYFDLVWATFKKVPQRSYKAIPVTSEWKMENEGDGRTKDAKPTSTSLKI